MTRTITTPEELRALPPRSVVLGRWPDGRTFTAIRSNDDAGGAAAGSYGIQGTREWLQMAEWGAELTVLHDTSLIVEAVRPMSDLRTALAALAASTARGVGYRVPGDHSTWGEYHEGRSDLGGEIEELLDSHPEPAKPSPDDREALAKITADAWNSVSTLECTSGSNGPRAVADAILAAGFRRPTVTPETIALEAAEAENLRLRARIWDEGYRRACMDHSTWCRKTDGDHGQHNINPYRSTP